MTASATKESAVTDGCLNAASVMGDLVGHRL